MQTAQQVQAAPRPRVESTAGRIAVRTQPRYTCESCGHQGPRGEFVAPMERARCPACGHVR